MALTVAQQKARENKLTASRVSILMNGSAEKLVGLWKEMLGMAEPEDLSHIWAVRLGEATEQLNLDWFQEKHGVPVIRRGEVVVHPDFEWAACTLDGWIDDASI